jgi:hypothetical protein
MQVYQQQIMDLEQAHKYEKDTMNERMQEMERHMDAMLNQNKTEQVGIDGLNNRLQDMSAYINHLK